VLKEKGTILGEIELVRMDGVLRYPFLETEEIKVLLNAAVKLQVSPTGRWSHSDARVLHSTDANLLDL
jgi:hypothetical protein